MNRALLGVLLGVLAGTVWGGQAVVARLAVTAQGLAPLDLAMFRYGPAALLLLPLLLRGWRAVAALGPWRILALAALGGVPNLLLFCWGLVYAPASHGGTIAPLTVTIMGAVFAIPLLGEWPTRGRGLALLAMAAGLLMIGWDGLAGGAAGAWRGDLLLFAAGSTWAGFSVLLRRWRAPAMPASAAVVLISLVVVAPLWVPLRAAEVLALPPGLLLWLVFAQGVMIGAVSMLLYARSLELLGATRAASLAVVMPVMALLLAWLVLGEAIGLVPLAGAALAVGGMLAAVLFTGRRTA